MAGITTGLGIVVRVRTTNDSNGNPRRGQMVYALSGEYLGFAAEDAAGERGTREAIVSHLYGAGVAWQRPASSHVVQAGDVEITPRQYRALAREAFPLNRPGKVGE